MIKTKSQILQEDYYNKTAGEYNSMHCSAENDPEHNLALHIMSSMIKYHGIKSILDIGSGTGRTILFIKSEHPEINIIGIEPVKLLREQGYANGILPTELIEGDGTQISFDNNQFDMVCIFGVLHHVSNPGVVIQEMLRVSNKFIFISDSNNFGQGSFVSRVLKQFINAIGLWPFFNFIRTKGKKYQISKGDGLFYSYSLHNNIKQIKRQCNAIYYFSTTNSGVNWYKTSSHIALLAIK